MDYITKPKSGIGENYDKLKWWDQAGKDARAKAKAAGDPNWDKLISAGEKTRLFKEMEFVASHTQFLYNAMGLPLITRSKPVAAMAFKLTSFPLNYWHKYLGEMNHRMWTGQPTYAGKGGPTLPLSARAGLAKHFIGMGLIIAGLEQAGFDYSSLTGLGYKPKEKKAIYPFSPGGVLSFRPSPGIQTLMNFKDRFSDQEWIRERAKERMGLFGIIPFPIPGEQLVKDITKGLAGDRKKVFFHTPYEPKTKGKPKREGITAFPSFNPFPKPSQVFKPFGR